MSFAFLGLVLLVIVGPPFTGYVFVSRLAQACQGSLYGIPASQLLGMLIQVRLCIDILTVIDGTAVLAVLLARRYRIRAITKGEPCLSSESA